MKGFPYTVVLINTCDYSESVTHHWARDPQRAIGEAIGGLADPEDYITDNPIYPEDGDGWISVAVFSGHCKERS